MVANANSENRLDQIKPNRLQEIWSNGFSDMPIKKFVNSVNESAERQNIHINRYDVFDFDQKWGDKFILLEYVDWLILHNKISLTASEISVYHYFIRYVNLEVGEVKTTISTISQKTKLSRPTIIKSIRNLNKYSLIEILYLSHTPKHMSKYRVSDSEELLNLYGKWAQQVKILT